jgi:hypothetical protein
MWTEPAPRSMVQLSLAAVSLPAGKAGLRRRAAVALAAALVLCLGGDGFRLLRRPAILGRGIGLHLLGGLFLLAAPAAAGA